MGVLSPVSASSDPRSDTHCQQARQYEEQDVDEEARARDLPIRPEIGGNRAQADHHPPGTDCQDYAAEPAPPDHAGSLAHAGRIG